MNQVSLKVGGTRGLTIGPGTDDKMVLMVITPTVNDTGEVITYEKEVNDDKIVKHVLYGKSEEVFVYFIYNDRG